MYIVQILHFQEIVHFETARNLVRLAEPSYSEAAYNRIINNRQGEAEKIDSENELIVSEKLSEEAVNNNDEGMNAVEAANNLLFKGRVYSDIDSRINKNLYLNINLELKNEVYKAELNYPIMLKLPFGIGDDIIIKDILVQRKWSGADNSCDATGFDAMERDDDDTYVFIFPRYGERYHEGGCWYLNRDEGKYIKCVSIYDATAGGYTKCQVCH